MRRVALALLLLLAVATPAFGDDAGRKHQLDSQIATLQNTLTGQRQKERALRSQVDDYTSRIRALEARVGDVSLRLTTLEEDLALHQKRLDALNALFNVQTDRLTTLRGEYRRSLDVLNKRLVDIYESDDPTTLDILFGSHSIQDAIDRVQALSEINAQDRAVSAAVARAKRQVTAARTKTKRLRGTVNAETAVIRARTDQTRAVRDELVGARNDLSSTKQQKLQDLSTLTEAERQEAGEIDALQAASARIAAQIRAAQAQNTGPTQTPSNAGLIWPVEGPVTSPFGWRWGRMHEGIDIGVGYGTPIHAAAGGTVIYCGWEEGYGNFVVIDHGGNLATAYGHQSSIAVTCGQQVNQGQVIGYVGCTGHCFGPHLHFEVRVNGNPVDPLGYLG
ncbi:MAG TPA: peptidoglycan DD-metalloendopeptidase family protein [Gaiellaceae bacterium]|nr:peptidoglycan DD-metalloendopeptidase family protein [Gaiellaceae bacterium]